MQESLLRDHEKPWSFCSHYRSGSPLQGYCAGRVEKTPPFFRDGQAPGSGILHGKGLPPRKSGTRSMKKEGVISMAQGCIFPLFFCSYFLQMNEEE
jgi:hypothetical protein